MEKPSLVILTAGMGSRYGGLKQLDIVGNNNENIIDFSIYNAIKAGFNNVILIIQKEHEPLFEEHIGKKIRPFINLTYAYQDINDLPDNFVCPENRIKPWGTAHALLCCRNIIKGPFAVINADDFYGYEAFNLMYQFLSNNTNDDFAMIGYRLFDTLSDNGPVTRAICNTNNGYLESIEEIQKIEKDSSAPYFYNKDGNKTEINDCICSMNFWGFKPQIFPLTMEYFTKWLKFNIKKKTAECVIPSVISSLLTEKKIQIIVLNSKSEWFGITYPEDKALVSQKIIEYKLKGIYPFSLWN